MPRRERARLFLRGLVKFVALVAVAGGCGVAIGYGLSRLSGEDDLASPVATGGTQTQTRPPAQAQTQTQTQRETPAAPTATAPPADTATTTVATGAASTQPTGVFAEVRVRILGAILRPAGTPDGQARRRARLTMRVQAVNEADEAVTIGRPVVAVGKVRIGTDTAADTADAQLGELAAGTTKAATLRFELAGEATEKITIDRRARINIAGRSLPFRLIVGSPVKPSESTPAAGTQTTP